MRTSASDTSVSHLVAMPRSAVSREELNLKQCEQLQNHVTGWRAGGHSAVRLPKPAFKRRRRPARWALGPLPAPHSVMPEQMSFTKAFQSQGAHKGGPCLQPQWEFLSPPPQHWWPLCLRRPVSCLASPRFQDPSSPGLQCEATHQVTRGPHGQLWAVLGARKPTHTAPVESGPPRKPCARSPSSRVVYGHLFVHQMQDIATTPH